MGKEDRVAMWALSLRAEGLGATAPSTSSPHSHLNPLCLSVVSTMP